MAMKLINVTRWRWDKTCGVVTWKRKQKEGNWKLRIGVTSRANCVTWTWDPAQPKINRESRPTLDLFLFFLSFSLSINTPYFFISHTHTLVGEWKLILRRKSSDPFPIRSLIHFHRSTHLWHLFLFIITILLFISLCVCVF